MARAIWRGAISFGMVSIPVKLYTATESKDVTFRQLVAEDLQPLRQLRWSPTLDREVQYDELIKGYEYAKDQYVEYAANPAYYRGAPKIQKLFIKIMPATNLLAQIQGCIVMGLGPALTEEIRFEGGKILNGSFADYRVPRFGDVPELDTHLLNRPDLPSVGGGETPIVASRSGAIPASARSSSRGASRGSISSPRPRSPRRSPARTPARSRARSRRPSTTSSPRARSRRASPSGWPASPSSRARRSAASSSRWPSRSSSST